MVELARTGIGKHVLPGHGGGAHPSHVGYDVPSPEGSEVYSRAHGRALSIFRLDNISNASTGLRLWQAETDNSGVSWTDPHPFVIPDLARANVTPGTRMAPGNGIELEHGAHAGRLLAVRKTAVIEAPCSPFTSDCQRFAPPRHLNHRRFWCLAGLDGGLPRHRAALPRGV
jgi:hypothetical protein